MDIKTAFLNGDLKEDIYMDQSKGFIDKRQENKVCKLVKSLYGLKLASKQRHQKFNKFIAHFEFIIHEYDKCIYSKKRASIQRNLIMITSLFVSMWMTFPYLVLLFMQSKG